jgi:hypothetical protein
MKQIKLTINHRGDPFNANAIPVGNSKHVQSISGAGSGTGPYYDIIAPAANYPDEAPTRYFIELPLIPNVSDFIGMPLILKDVTSGTVLTKVTSSPGVNQYRYVPDQTGIYRPQVIELHAGQTGHTIGYDYYGIQTVLNKEDFDQLSTNPGISGIQMFFDVAKGAFRAGNDAIANKWNNANVGTNSFAVGSNTKASDSYSFAEGENTIASGNSSHAEGNSNTASGSCSHAEGNSNTASGSNSHSEGSSCIASGGDSHAEGTGSTAYGLSSHAQGASAYSLRDYQHSIAASGFTTAGDAQHCNLVKYGTVANNSNSNFDFTTETGKSYCMEYQIIFRNSSGVSAMATGNLICRNNAGTATVASEAGSPVLTASGTTGFAVVVSGTGAIIRINVAQGASGVAARVVITYIWTEVLY